jgi:hypothetical protein
MTTPEEEKSDVHIMWIGSALIVLLILGAMGFNMLITHDPNDEQSVGRGGTEIDQVVVPRA